MATILSPVANWLVFTWEGSLANNILLYYVFTFWQILFAGNLVLLLTTEIFVFRNRINIYWKGRTNCEFNSLNRELGISESNFPFMISLKKFIQSIRTAFLSVVGGDSCFRLKSRHLFLVLFIFYWSKDLKIKSKLGQGCTSLEIFLHPKLKFNEEIYWFYFLLELCLNFRLYDPISLLLWTQFILVLITGPWQLPFFCK